MITIEEPLMSTTSEEPTLGVVFLLFFKNLLTR